MLNLEKQKQILIDNIGMCLWIYISNVEKLITERNQNIDMF